MSEWFESWFDSPYYHILYDNRDNSEAGKFINNLLQSGNYNPDTRILDLACGKGRHAIYLNSLGFRVTGADLSEASIKCASECKSPGLSFKRHDMRDPMQADSFDLVLNLFTSFGYFENSEENLTVLRNIHECLSKSGRLVIDFMNADKVIEKMIPYETIVKNEISFRIERKTENGFVQKKISFSAGGKNFEYLEKVQLFRLEDFKTMLSKSGFKLTAVYGDYNLGKFVAAQSDRLILIADKISDK